MENVRTFAVFVAFMVALLHGAAAPAKEDDMLAEDVVAFLIGFRDMAIFQPRATVQLDHRFVEGVGIEPLLHKVGPGSFISPLIDEAGSGFFGTSIRRVDRCQFEERYTIVGQPERKDLPARNLSSNPDINVPFTVNRALEITGDPDKVYDFSDAAFEVVTGQGGQWNLEVTGQGVFCLGGKQFCVGAANLGDITVTPSENDRKQKAEDLKRIVGHFQQSVCPGAAP